MADVSPRPIAFASGDGNGNSKEEASLNRPKVRTNRSAGAVRWRGESRRPNELGFH